MSLFVDNYKNVFDHSLGFGQKPAILVVDFVKAYTTVGSPLYAQPVCQAIEQTKLLLDIARPQGIPIIFTQVLYNANFKDGGLFVQKIPALQNMVHGNTLAEISDELSVHDEDLVLVKQYASAFFGTSLASSLASMKIDTLILTGCSTSGCIRATAVDGMQHGLRVIVPRECVADRHIAPHEANLFDINAKYGDVLSLSETIERCQLYTSGSK